jgi:ubiquinone/menaquinone biosynthesis C-methylase UbiE
MIWLITILLAVLVLLVVAGFRKMHIPREPQREGPEDAQVVEGYNRFSRWPVMMAERYLVLRVMKPLGPAGTLVDVGCGPGYLANSIRRGFPHLRIICMDISRDMLHRAGRNFPGKNIEFLSGDAQAMPFADGAIDFIVSTGAFHHWESGLGALREFHRVLKPGGQLLVFDLRRDMRHIFYWLTKLLQAFMPADIKRVNGAVGSVWASYTVEEMESLLHKSPFAVWRLYPAPGWMIIKGRKRRIRKVPATSVIPRTKKSRVISG